MANDQTLPRKDTKLLGFRIPKTSNQLNEYWTEYNIQPLSEMDKKCIGSGSKITDPQFYSLRTVIKKLQKCDVFMKRLRVYELDAFWQTAMNLINGSNEFQAYFWVLETATRIKTMSEKSEDWPGSLKPVRLIQEQIIYHEKDEMAANQPKRPKRKAVTRPNPPSMRDEGQEEEEEDQDEGQSSDSDPPFEEPIEEPKNEATPQAALILLLQATRGLVEKAKAEWVFDHDHFIIQSGDIRCESYTDGALKCDITDSILAILEVKKCPRTTAGGARIQLQESQEYVGWYVHEDEWEFTLNGCRVLISQDLDGMFISFARHHGRYLDYIRGNTLTAIERESSFLEISTYGPWKIQDKMQMENFCILMTAIALAVKRSNPKSSNLAAEDSEPVANPGPSSAGV